MKCRIQCRTSIPLRLIISDDAPEVLLEGDKPSFPSVWQILSAVSVGAATKNCPRFDVFYRTLLEVNVCGGEAGDHELDIRNDLENGQPLYVLAFTIQEGHPLICFGSLYIVGDDTPLVISLDDIDPYPDVFLSKPVSTHSQYTCGRGGHAPLKLLSVEHFFTQFFVEKRLFL